MSGLNGFEQAVKEALEPYEVPYNSADWSQLERALENRGDMARVSRSGLYALLLGGGMAAASSLFVLTTPPPSTVAPVQIAQVASSMPEANVAGTLNTTIVDQAEGASAQVSLGASVENSVTKTGHKTESSTRTEVASLTGDDPSIVTPSVPVHPMSNEPLVRPSVSEGCPGSAIDFEAENLSSEGMYLWNFGDGSFSNKPKPSHVFSKSGSFEVMLSHSTSGGGSIRNKAVADRIIIHEAPEASFNVLKQEYDNTVPSVHFENRSLGGQTYRWDFGDGGTSTVAHPDHVYKKAGVYTVSLTVVNGKGCEDHSEKTVRIDADYDLMAPRTFSPNGDGMDDLFIPEALKTLGVKFQLSVFESKTGVLVYETNDATRPWNGRVNNKGEASPQGDYVWMVELKDGDKLGGPYNGSIRLVR